MLREVSPGAEEKTQETGRGLGSQVSCSGSNELEERLVCLRVKDRAEPAALTRGPAFDHCINITHYNVSPVKTFHYGFVVKVPISRFFFFFFCKYFLYIPKLSKWLFLVKHEASRFIMTLVRTLFWNFTCALNEQCILKCNLHSLRTAMPSWMNLLHKISMWKQSFTVWGFIPQYYSLQRKPLCSL